MYLQAQARNPGDSIARAGIAEVRERLLAKAENALLEERLDEAAAAIETARKSGVESGRIAFLTAQLGKSREQVKAAQAAVHVRNLPKAETDAVSPLLDLAAQRSNAARLIEPAQDSALYYVQRGVAARSRQRRRSGSQTDARDALLTEARGAIDRRDFARAAALLEAAKGIAAAPNVEAAQSLLAAARRQADADAWSQLLKNATERSQQDRLIEPANDSAKYYLMTLRSLDPSNPGLAAATSDLGTRLVVKARRALTWHSTTRRGAGWMKQAPSASRRPNPMSATRDLDAAVAANNFMANIVAAGELTSGQVGNAEVPAESRVEQGPGMGGVGFHRRRERRGQGRRGSRHRALPGYSRTAAIGALSQWRYKPVMRDSKAVPQRARIRIRFTFAGT